MDEFISPGKVNQSATKLEVNGKQSSRKCSPHVKSKYFL